MRDAGRRPVGRLCCLLVIAAWGFWLPAGEAQSGPASTTVADTVYLADGTAAQGTMIISWPAFQTASGAPIAAGTTNVAVTNGTFSVGLVPNAGATPAGVYYSVVYQLGPGEVKTEYWVVPTTSPANLAAVRTTPGSGVAGQPVSMQYVNSELAIKADDSSVVHLAGTETISGTKTFASAPNVPAPISSGQVASKGYVDQAVSNVGAGNFLPTAGGTMTGPITLPGSPAAPLQATTKQYVDTALASKSDLISGLVPAGELGTGQATASNCLLGNGTWAPCAAGGSGNLSTTPTGSQTIAQPAGTQFSANNLANIRYVTPSWNWAQTPADSLLTPGSLTIHLSPCPLGIDTASSSNNYPYKVYISGKGTPEAAPVTGGNCTPGATSGTITVTTANSHAAGYTVGSASSGIQEAWNDAWAGDGCANASNCSAPYVKLTADTNYNVYASVYLRGRGGMLDGAGALIVCSTRDRCLFIGSPPSGIGYHKIYNLTGGSTLNVDGVQVASVTASSGTYTVTTAGSHPFLVGDMAACEYHSQSSDQRWVSQVISVPNAATFVVSFGAVTFPTSANTFGFCNILNTFIEDASDHVALEDIHITQTNPSTMGAFSYGITNDNDQQFIIERAANRSTAVIKSTANWPLGSFFYQRTDGYNAGIMYVHDTELTGVNCADGGGNGFVMTDTVCQGFPVYGVRYFGGYQPSTYQNVYEESTGGSGNPLYAGSLPAQMGILVQGGMGHRIVGTFPVAGWTPTFASGGGTAAQRNYYVVPRSSTQGYGAMWFIGSAQPTSGSVSINLQWPSIQLQDGYAHQSLGTLTWDILVTTGTSGNSPAPYGTGNFAVVTNVSGSCNTAGMCSYTDTQAPLSSYTVQLQQFTPAFWFWPSNLAVNNTTVFADVGYTSPGVVATQGTGNTALVAPQCQSLGMGYQRSPLVEACETISNPYHATLWPNLNGTPANSKGRFNFGAYQNAPNDFITLYDSNFAKTAATAGERPSADAGDTAIGADQAGGLSQRAATSITSYINALPSGSNFQERLTAGGKTINVPLTVNGGLAVSGGNVTLPVTGTGSQCLHVSSTGVLSGTGADCGSGGTSGTVNIGSTSQVAMYSGNGSAVSGDGTLTDNGTTLNYAGSGGITAATGTFSGNLTVNGQLLVAGPWAVSSPIPGAAMGAAGTGTSALGISNDGNFYISANGGTPQKVSTSNYSNLWQEDPNDVGLYNGATAQGFHVYSNYSTSTWQRTSLGYDATDNLAVVRSENSTSSLAPGLGFWIGSSVRWAIDSTSTLKPFANNAIDLGSTTFAPRTVYAGTSFDMMTQGRQNFELCNDGTTGTSLNFLAKYNGGNPECAVKTGTADTDGVIGVVSNNSGTSGNAVITYRGYASCSFDSSVVLGDYVVASTTNPGDCHDGGASRPTGVQVLGRVESLSPGGGTYGVRISLDAPGGTGAPVSSPTFTGTVTLPDGTTDSASGIALGSAVALPNGSTGTTAATSDNSTKVATTAYVQNQNYQINTPRSLDASLENGTTLDVKLNSANALAITSGNSVVDARALGGTQTIANEVSIGELRPPVVTAVSGTSPGAGTYKVVYTLTSPTATETSASMESTITVTGSQAIQVASPTYYGTATSYSVYVTPVGVAGVGTVNTSNTTVTWVSGTQFTTGTAWNNQNIYINGAWFIVASVSSATSLTLTAGAGTQSGVVYNTGNWAELKCTSATNVAIGTNATISAACSGAAVSGSNKGFGVALIPPHTGVWTVTVADSVPNTSCGLRFFDQSSFLGDGAGVGRPWYLSSNSSTNVEGLFCTDNNPKTGGGYYNIKGMAAHSTGSDTIQTGVCVLFGMFDVSVFDDMQCLAYQSYPAGVVYAYNTGASSRISGSFNGGNVGQPLVIGGGNGGMGVGDLDFHDMSVTAPGNSYPNIAILGASTSIHFSGTLYMEGPISGACADAIQIATQNNVNGPIIFDSVHHGANCSGTSSYLFSVPSTFTPAVLKVDGIRTGNFTNVFKYTPNTALNIAGVGTGASHPGFELDNTNPKLILTNFQVLGTTTLATATATTPTTADNSTKVATTAFVQNQAYAPLASPALTGVPTAPTASPGTNSTQIATTAYVDGNYISPSLDWGYGWGATAGTNTIPFNAATGKMNVFGIYIDRPVKCSGITVYVVTGDNSANTYDIGLFYGVSGSSNNLIAHTGAVAGSSYFATGSTFATVPFGATITLMPGRYYLGLYANEASAPLAIASNNGANVLFYHYNAASITPVSGGLPGTFTGPSDGLTASYAPKFLLK
jgi:hypothetical protein